MSGVDKPLSTTVSSDANCSSSASFSHLYAHGQHAKQLLLFCTDTGQALLRIIYQDQVAAGASCRYPSCISTCNSLGSTAKCGKKASMYLIMNADEVGSADHAGVSFVSWTRMCSSSGRTSYCRRRQCRLLITPVLAWLVLIATCKATLIPYAAQAGW
jgi:hypothetical protein